jgi:hypothetical protein
MDRSGEILSTIDHGQDLSGSARQSGSGYRRAAMPGQLVGHAPGQQFVDAVDLVVGDMGEHVFEVGPWVDSIELATPDQAVHRCCPLASRIGAGEHKIFATTQNSA